MTHADATYQWLSCRWKHFLTTRKLAKQVFHGRITVERQRIGTCHARSEDNGAKSCMLAHRFLSWFPDQTRSRCELLPGTQPRTCTHSQVSATCIATMTSRACFESVLFKYSCGDSYTAVFVVAPPVLITLHMRVDRAICIGTVFDSRRVHRDVCSAPCRSQSAGERRHRRRLASPHA